MHFTNARIYGTRCHRTSYYLQASLRVCTCGSPISRAMEQGRTKGGRAYGQRMCLARSSAMSVLTIVQRISLAIQSVLSAVLQIASTVQLARASSSSSHMTASSATLFCYAPDALHALATLTGAFLLQVRRG